MVAKPYIYSSAILAVYCCLALCQAGCFASSPQADWLKGTIRRPDIYVGPLGNKATAKSIDDAVLLKLWDSYIHAGRTAYADSDLNTAEIMYGKSEKIARQLSHPNIYLAISLTNLGAVYRDQGNYEQAENALKQAMEIKQKILADNALSDSERKKEARSLAQTMTHYARLLSKEGKVDEASAWEGKAQTAISQANAPLRVTVPVSDMNALNGVISAGNIFADFPSQPMVPISATHSITHISSLNSQDRDPVQMRITVMRIRAIVFGEPRACCPPRPRCGRCVAVDGPFSSAFDLGSSASEDSNWQDATNLASAYGITNPLLSRLGTAGGQLIEVDYNWLFYVSSPLNPRQWHVGTAVDIMRAPRMSGDDFLLTSIDEDLRLAVTRLAAR